MPLLPTESTPISTTSTPATGRHRTSSACSSHYDAVVWYPGDDVVTRKATQTAGDADRLALDEMLEMRAYMNEGGKVLYTGDTSRRPVHRQCREPALRPTEHAQLLGSRRPMIDPRRCLSLRGSGDGVNDVLQYYFGGYLAVARRRPRRERCTRSA